MNINYKIKSFDESINEILPLSKKHYEEICVFSDHNHLFNPNLKLYKLLDESKSIKIYCAYLDETLIGYLVYNVYPHSHLENLYVATQDLFYVVKEYRKNGVGDGLIKFSEKDLKENKINFIIQCVSIKNDFSPILFKNGYKPLDCNFIKEL